MNLIQEMISLEGGKNRQCLKFHAHPMFFALPAIDKNTKCSTEIFIKVANSRKV